MLYVKIYPMKPQFSNNHPSYKNHRRQLWLQIFLPLLITILLMIVIAVLAGLSAFGENGNAPLWTAIATIWLVIPVMVFGLIFLVLIAGLIYLLAQIANVIPPYTAKAQYYVNRVSNETKHFSDMAVKPVLFLEGITASLKAFLGRK